MPDHADLPEGICRNSPRNAAPGAGAGRIEAPRRGNSGTTLRELLELFVRRWRLLAAIEGGLLLACLLYCLIAPNQYEATAKVALRTAPASALGIEAASPLTSASILSGPLQQETIASYLRSDQLAWRVISALKLYDAAGFNGRFPQKFPDYVEQRAGSDAAAQAYLLERFQRRLRVEVMPRSLVIQIRFRTRDAALSAAVVNELIAGYSDQEGETRIATTAAQSEWLKAQLKDLKNRVEQDQAQLIAFQAKHGLLNTPETQTNGQPGEALRNSTLLEMDELGRQLVAATTDRILREAEYRSASEGDPEVAVAAEPRMQGESGDFATALLEQIHARQSELEVEQAQLSAEHGPNFPRVVEIRRQLEDLTAQKKAVDGKLVERFKTVWKTAVEREQMVKKALDAQTAEGMKLNQDATNYAVMRQEANSSHAVYLHVLERLEEAGLSAGVPASNIVVVDRARQPVRPVAPDLLLYMAITFFAGLWVAIGVALGMESLGKGGMTKELVAALLILLAGGQSLRAQAPTPALDGLPTGVARLPLTQETRVTPDARQAPPVWNGQVQAGQAGLPGGGESAATQMAAPLGAGDFLDVSEFHTPEFHTQVRVSAAGTVTLPLVDEVAVGGMDERGAAQAIEAALTGKGMLLHPRVAVLVLVYAGQDVSVLGEVAKPGVYPYTLHHRLLDLISAASGLSPNAGRLVNVFHRGDPKHAHPMVLDPGGEDATVDHNPELMPGDTVQVSRAGLVFVIGDVVRPGGFPVDPAQGLTVVQALSLAWGTSENAAAERALLIHEEKGGRTLTTLNLKKMMHGQEPDRPIHDRDILFVPDSMARNLWNRTLESAIQSAVGVTIYAGLVYSQRF